MQPIVKETDDYSVSFSSQSDVVTLKSAYYAGAFTKADELLTQMHFIRTFDFQLGGEWNSVELKEALSKGKKIRVTIEVL